MKRLLFLLITIVSLYGNDTILESYRHNGMDGIEQKLDNALTSLTYWQNVMQKADTTFGYIEAYDSILICDKNESTLKLYQKDSNNTYVLKNSYNAFTGKNKGDKFYEGDLKTPVGIYHLTNKLLKVDSFYGPMAFVTSYPNLYDKYLGKDGHGIWIHGLPINQKRDEFTKGCIAIDNKSLTCLDKVIDLKKTILLIFENQTILPTQKEQLASIASWLYKWRYAWKYNDLEKYLSFYARDFKRYDGKDFEAFKKYKTLIFARNQKKSIIFNDLTIIPYPNHSDVFMITFYERYRSGRYTFKGNKELLIRTKNDTFEIFSEK